MKSVNFAKTGYHGNAKVDIRNTEKEIVSLDMI